MAVCNVFNRLENNTGNFLMFSQYVEDLTRESTQSVFYRVTPSKFIAANIDYSEYNDEHLVRELQNRFENGCAVCRKNMESSWTPSTSSNLFWRTIFDMGLFTSTDGSYLNEVKYIGDINLQSYNEHDGLGYSEIYCYIPNEACESKIQYVNNEPYGTEYKSDLIIEGYRPEEIDGRGIIGEILNYYPETVSYFPWDVDSLDVKKVDSDNFNINTIIVLYDVVTKVDNGTEVLYKNIPLGIYFTGVIKNGIMTNTITKYVSNKDIFGAGTSYGLRICSRFTVTPNQDNIKVLDVTVDNDNYSAICQVMSQMAISQNKMDEILAKVQSNNNAEKELLAIFKNSRTNVPYIKVINDTSYWFVNGRNLGPVLGDIDCECVPYEDQEIIDMLNRSISLILNVQASNVDGDKVFDYSVDGPQTIYINWELLLNDKITVPEELTLNGISLDKNITHYMVENVYETTTYNISAKKENLIADNSDTVYFVWPTYFGMLPCDNCSEGKSHNFIPSESNIKNLTKNVKTSKVQDYNYTNKTRENGETDHVVLAYPASFGPLISILDDYSYEYLHDFIKHDVKFTFDGREVDYYVYVDKFPAEVENFTLKFK